MVPSLHTFAVKAFDTQLNVTKEFFCPKLLFVLGGVIFEDLRPYLQNNGPYF